MPNAQRILAVFAKWPAPGRVKTRLGAATSPEFAAQVADAFLDDTLDRWSNYRATRVLAYTPPTEKNSFTIRVRKQWHLTPQSEGGLGPRMRDFFAAQHASAPQSPVVLIGTDSPTLPIEYMDQAFAALADFDVVLGPATDGGFYLVGGTAAMPLDIFDIEYGRSDVLLETIARIPPATKVHILPPWYDVDTLDDWRMLCGHIAAMRRAGVDPMTPRVERLMKDEERRTKNEE